MGYLRGCYTVQTSVTAGLEKVVPPLKACVRGKEPLTGICRLAIFTHGYLFIPHIACILISFITSLHDPLLTSPCFTTNLTLVRSDPPCLLCNIGLVHFNFSQSCSKTLNMDVDCPAENISAFSYFFSDCQLLQFHQGLVQQSGCPV